MTTTSDTDEDRFKPIEKIINDQSEKISQDYTLLELLPCGCVLSVMHNAHQNPSGAARKLISAMQKRGQIKCLPAQLADCIPWTCRQHLLT